MKKLGRARKLLKSAAPCNPRYGWKKGQGKCVRNERKLNQEDMSDQTFSKNGETWDIKDLWKAAENEPVQKVPTSSFNKILDEDFWYSWDDEEGNMVTETPTFGSILDHAKRAMDADTSYPIIVTPDGDIADGLHRIMRHMIEGKTEIPFVKLKKMPQSK